MKNLDAQDVALRLRVLPWAIVAGGLVIGPALMAGASLPRALLYALIAAVLAYLLPIFFLERAANAGAAVLGGSGASTPSLRQFSLADSLVARGQLNEAAEAYQMLAEDFPEDPEPRIRLARLQRDRMNELNEAADSFRKALACEGMQQANAIAITRELTELYIHKMKQPALALPYLARLADENPGHPVEAWARAEYADIKRAQLAQHDG